MRRKVSLVLVRLLHTAVWAIFAGLIMALPFVALLGHYRLAAGFSAAIVGEVGILAACGWRCPLTAVAARYTEDRDDNFDIYLPRWLARYNKEIFGTLFVLGGGVALWSWLRS